jgi:two-component system, chemotaxis family, sensor kinase Cph1
VTRPRIPGVPMPQAPTTVFGKADLSNCEREQIHLAGSIQPHGAMLVLREPGLDIVQASANARDFLASAGEPIGRSLDQIGGNLAARLREHLDGPLEQIPTRCAAASAESKAKSTASCTARRGAS